MLIFLDTANIDEIREAASPGNDTCFFRQLLVGRSEGSKAYRDYFLVGN